MVSSVEFGSWEEATSKAVKAPTTTKWIDRVKKNVGGREIVRCRLVACDFKPRREGPSDDLLAAMPPVEAKKASFAGVREKRRQQAQNEVKLMRIDVKNEYFNAKCAEEEWVELPDEFKKFGKYARWLYGMRKCSVRMGR